MSLPLQRVVSIDLVVGEVPAQVRNQPELDLPYLYDVTPIFPTFDDLLAMPTRRPQPVATYRDQDATDPAWGWIVRMGELS